MLFIVCKITTILNVKHFKYFAVHGIYRYNDAEI
jgi:hypothetical protein